MNMNMSRNHFFRSVWLVAVLFAVFFPVPALRAQPAEREGHGRFLFVFDTSANLKQRGPAVEKSLNTLLATSMNGQMHTGDTIGVWTFNQDLHPGDFPLQAWNSADAVMTASNLTQFVRRQKYANKARFEVLQPLLNRVVEGSERLTVLIFSDGATKITGTTFDAGINQLFEQNAAARKKAREPFVVVLRSQQGKYVGCTVSYPPQLVSFPQFPPLPPLPEPPPAPKPVPAPPPAPAVIVPSMVITGSTSELPLAPPAAKPAPAIPPPAIESAPVVEPSVAPAVPGVPPPPAGTVMPAAPANPPAIPPVNPPAPSAAPVVIASSNPVVPPRDATIVPAAAPVTPANAQTPGL